MRTPIATIIAMALCMLLQLPAVAQEETLPYKYVGNSFTHIFHRPSCEFAQRIWHTRVQLFHFRRDAIAAKYKPCNWCLPKRWWTVKGKILNAPTVR